MLLLVITAAVSLLPNSASPVAMADGGDRLPLGVRLDRRDLTSNTVAWTPGILGLLPRQWLRIRPQRRLIPAVLPLTWSDSALHVFEAVPPDQLPTPPSPASAGEGDWTGRTTLATSVSGRYP